MSNPSRCPLWQAGAPDRRAGKAAGSPHVPPPGALTGSSPPNSERRGRREENASGGGATYRAEPERAAARVPAALCLLPRRWRAPPGRPQPRRAASSLRRPDSPARGSRSGSGSGSVPSPGPRRRCGSAQSRAPPPPPPPPAGPPPAAAAALGSAALGAWGRLPPARRAPPSRSLQAVRTRGPGAFPSPAPRRPAHLGSRAVSRGRVAFPGTGGRAPVTQSPSSRLPGVGDPRAPSGREGAPGRREAGIR
ncbi:hypothetical protein AAY473_016688 [Plecturocebus cupreus]